MRSPVFRVAAAVAVVLLVVAGVVLWFHVGGTTFAFADFVAPILEARTVKHKATVEMKGPSAMTVTSEFMVLDGARTRRETEMPDKSKMVHITDWSQGKHLILNTAAKQATVRTFDNTENVRDDPSLWFRLFRLAAQDALNKPGVQRELLGEKEIDGRRLVGFRIGVGGQVMDLWGDPKTGLPVRVEMTMGVDANMKLTMSDFAFNVDLDESLFSVEPPAGYTVRNEQMKTDDSPRGEKDLIEMFREYSRLSGGAFPDSLDLLTLTKAYSNKFHVQMMWDNIQMQVSENMFPWKEKPNEEQRLKFEEQRIEFEEQMLEIMDEVMKKTLEGKPYEEQTRKMEEQIRKIMIQMFWEHLAPATWKANEQRRHEFEERMLQVMEGKSNGEQGRKMAEEMSKLMIQVLWEDLAPAKWKTDDERRRQFEELMRKREGAEPKEKQEIEEEFRKILGDQMLKAVEAREAQMEKATEARQAQMQKTAEIQKARQREFREAEQRVQRGVRWASQLPPGADAHYVGKGVSLGAADTPIFWYRPKDSEKYRVIYADLSVREADAPPGVPEPQPVSDPASPKEQPRSETKRGERRFSALGSAEE